MDLAALAVALRGVTVELTDADAGPAIGSGVVWAPELVVTNAHVVPGSHPRVRRADGGMARGRVVTRDRQADLALLHVPELGLPVATVGSAAELRVGSLLVAVGHPFGIRGALTTGIVHALDSRGRASRSWIQGDLRLGPGNSGGPLADARGRVVGINAMIVGGLALAIPASEVTRFVQAAG
jgi:serine protease Do